MLLHVLIKTTRHAVLSPTFSLRACVCVQPTCSENERHFGRRTNKYGDEEDDGGE